MHPILLLADDDMDDIDLFREAVAEIEPDTTCYTANNGKAVLTLLKQEGVKHPDAILLDINMPEMNGWECLRLLKEDTKLAAIPVIMYSTSSYDKDAERAKALGVVYFFTKPDSYNRLRYIISVIIRCVETNTVYDIAGQVKD